MIGERLKELREKQGYGLKRLSSLVNITDSRLCKMENNIIPCRPDELRTLAQFYGVSLIDLFIEAGYITKDDLEDYRMFFHGIKELDQDEIDHIQQCIDLLNRKRK